jgi:hypothetical protein
MPNNSGLEPTRCESAHSERMSTMTANLARPPILPIATGRRDEV